MLKNGVTIEKKDNKIHFYSCSEQNRCIYLYSKPFTLGEYLYFRGDRSMDVLYSFHNWGKNPRLDKTIKRVIKMCKYVEKDFSDAKCYVTKLYEPVVSKKGKSVIDYDR